MCGNKLEKLRNMDADRCLFLLGNVFLFIGLLIGSILLIGNITIGTGEDCAFHRLTGLYCMGCGGTRAMLAYFKGDLLTSMKYHLFTAYGLTFFILFMGSHYLRLLTKGRIKGMHFRMVYIMIGVTLLIGQFVIRNIMLVRYGSILWPVG